MIVFISDLHLEESRPDITGAFLYFMDTIQEKAHTLYILGDFFEAWIGDDEDTALQLQVKARLKQYTAQGKRLFFMHGNRDFLIGELFCQQTGATLLPDPSIVDIKNHPVLLMHGDSLCTHDTSYMKFRNTIRNPAFLEPFLKRPIAERKVTAQQLRAMSQANNQEKSSEIMDVTPEEVPLNMEKYHSHTLIHGHTHRPKVHDLDVAGVPSKRIVLGDWDKEIWFLEIPDIGEPALKTLPFPEQ